MQQNLIEDYLEFCKDTEPPLIFRRWCIMTGVAALLGRRVYVQHGHNQIFPNIYAMLVGEAGSRKSTCVSHVKGMLQAVGYEDIAANKTSKEKFLMDLEAGIAASRKQGDRFDIRNVDPNKGRNPTMRELFGAEHATDPALCLIAADEFNTFMGHSNVEFIDLLTELWDYKGPYENRIKNGRSVRFFDPTISIMGGNTSVGISMAFPKEVIGQGFFARLIQVFAEPSGRRIAFPPHPDPDQYAELLRLLKEIKEMTGEFQFDSTAWSAMEEIYNKWTDLEDVRFKSYSNRRFTHLLKTCIVCAACFRTNKITLEVVEYANTVLHYTEYFMPRALGEFGKARNSDVNAKVLGILETASKPLDLLRDIYPLVRRDLNNAKELSDIMRNLIAGGKVQVIAKAGFLLNKEPPKFNYPVCKISLMREWREQQLKDGLIP